MKKCICCMIVICLILSASRVYDCKAAEKPAKSELYSLSAALIDGDSGRVLFDKNGEDERAMASTTKIMTLILALEYGNPDDMVTVSSYAAKMPDVQLNIREGEQYRLGDLLYSMMLESHNDSAVAIAEHIGGNVENFAAMMNQKAGELGLSHTYFITPNGLDAENEEGKHQTTAVELALVMRYCVMDSPAREEFIRICQTREYSFGDYTGTRHFTVSNKNRFLDMMEGVIAGKTGFTADAGYCYVAAVTRDDKTYIIALLGCGWPGNKSYKWSDAKKLFTYGMENYDYQNVVDESYELEDIGVRDGIGRDTLPLYVKDEVRLVLSEEDSVEIRENIPLTLAAPVRRDDIVGTLDIYVNNEPYTAVNVYAADTVRRVNYGYYLEQVIGRFLFW